MSSPQLPQQPERELVQGVIKTLRAYGCLAWRMNTGMIKLRDEHTERDRVIHMGMPGLPDVGGVLPGGTFIGVECKRVGNRPTKLQLFILDEIRRRQAHAVLAYDVRDVQAVVDAALRRR